MANNIEHYFNVMSKKVTTSEKLVETVAILALYNFKWRYVTLIVFNLSYFWRIDVLANFYQKNIIVSNSTGAYPTDTKQFVLLENSVVNIVEALEWMRRNKYDNTGKFVIACLSEINENCNENEAIKLFWRFKITNVIFIKSTPYTEEINAYTYQFLQDETCRESPPIKLDKIDTCLAKKELKICDMFSVKYLNLHRCPLIVSTFAQPPYMIIDDGKPTGSDGELLLIIMDALNATFKIMTPQHGDGWGTLCSNGTWLGSLGDIYNGVANLSITYPIVTLSRFINFQASYAYNFINIGWVIHPPVLQSSSLKLIHPFQPGAQKASLISFFLVAIFVCFSSTNIWAKICKKFRIDRPKSGVFFFTCMICIGMPLKKMPKSRTLILLWIWYCFLLRTFYQTSLINSLKKNYFERNFETIEEIIDAGYSFGGGAPLKEFYIDYPSVYDNYVPVNTTETVILLKNISEGRKFAFGMNLEHARTFINKGRGNLHMLQQKIAVGPTAIFFKKFSPYIDSINRIITRLNEGGIIMQLHKTFHTHKTIRKGQGDQNNEEPINMIHYTGCYALLCIGWFTSILSFIFELFYHKWTIKL